MQPARVDSQVPTLELTGAPPARVDLLPLTQVDHKDTLSIIITGRQMDRTCILNESQV